MVFIVVFVVFVVFCQVVIHAYIGMTETMV
jgi:hypothetical protein